MPSTCKDRTNILDPVPAFRELSLSVGSGHRNTVHKEGFKCYKVKKRRVMRWEGEHEPLAAGLRGGDGQFKCSPFTPHTLL